MNIKRLIEQFVKFGMVGAFNTIFGLVIYWVLVHLGVHYLIANAVGFTITVAISYCLNNIFTFRDKDMEKKWSILGLAKSYVSYSVTGIFLNSALLWLWNDYLSINQDLAPVLNLFITVPVNFVLNKFWVFARKDSIEETDTGKTE